MALILEEKFARLVSETSTHAPADIAERVIFFLETKMKAQAKMRAVLYCILSAVSGAAFYVAGAAVVADIGANGAGRIFSLIFSDFHSVVANWNYFLLSLVESLPILPLIAALLSVGILFAMATLAIADFRKIGGIKIAFGRRA